MKTDNFSHKADKEGPKTKVKAIFYNMNIKNNICEDCGKKSQWIILQFTMV